MYHLGWQAQQHPDAIAVIESDGTTRSYREVDRHSRHLAAALGMKPGKSIAIRMPSGAAFLEVAWAAQRAGLYYTPVNTQLRPTEINALVNQKRLITEKVYERLLAARITRESPECEGQELLYTWSTPKAVRSQFTRRPMGDPTSRCVRVALGMTQYGFGPDTVYLALAPLYHAAPLVQCMSVLRLGGTVVVMDTFDPQGCLDLIERHRVTHAQFVPTLFDQMLKLPDEDHTRDLSGVRLVSDSTAPFPIEVKQQVLARFGTTIQELDEATISAG